MASFAEESGPELFLGLVGAVGTDLNLLTTTLQTCLSEVRYRSMPLHLIELIHEIPEWKEIPENPLDVRYQAHMDKGNEFRRKMQRGDALVAYAIGAIRDLREDVTADPTRPVPRGAYILRSLKHPDEVMTLRRIYASRLLLLAAYSPRETRVQNLTRRIAESHHVFETNQFRDRGEALIQRDEAEVDDEFGQNVRETFPLADVFIDVSDPVALRAEVARFVELLFGNTFHTPTRDEYAMFHAKAAKLRSGSLSRQVGVVICTRNGDIIAVGTNEVPKAGGGLYWAGDPQDRRDHVLGFDTSDRMRKSLLGDVLKRLRDAGWFVKEKQTSEIDKLVEEALRTKPFPDVKRSHLMSVIEFGRSVHGEMAALMDAARRGVGVEGCTLYTTTFPCHDCARHIVAAGIERVVYIEPYPKSRVPELYPDSIAVDTPGRNPNQVSFEPFVGVSPNRYMDLFSMLPRKKEDGSGAVIEWERSGATPRLDDYSTFYLVGEQGEFNLFEKEMVVKGLIQEAGKEVGNG